MRASEGAPTVLAAVMTYNRKDVLRRCLAAIRAQTLSPSGVLLLDNGCTDGTAEIVARDFPEVRVHRTGENLGSAGAIREALRVALETAPDYVWFFDDDVIADPACLEILLREMRSLEPDVRVGVLRPMVRDPRTGEVGGGATPHAALLSGAMVRDVGLPPGETFMELSDHIYSAMIRRRGYLI
ncbi:MAG: glycosyltransferase, partial [Anaerolineales bacterium]